jgi:hypothetical protein
MGISDEDYANALEHQRLHERALMKMAIQNQQQTLEHTIQNASTAVQMPYGQFKALTEQDLHHEAMKAPLSALIDMWLARWQGEWVSETNFQEDDFWRITLVRLTGANKLEKHNLATQMSPVYRIIE